MEPPPPITSPYAPDLQEVRGWLETMVRAMRFLEMITAILAFIARMCEVNRELNKKLADLRRQRPRSETLERLARQLLLPFGTIPSSAQGAGAQTRPKADKRKLPRDRKGRHPGRAPLPAHLERILVPNPVPPEMRRCPRCGTEMTTVGHSSCEILSVIPARVVVNVRLDERVACPNDHSIVTAPTPPAIVERGKLADPLIVEATCDKYRNRCVCPTWSRGAQPETTRRCAGNTRLRRGSGSLLW